MKDVKFDLGKTRKKKEIISITIPASAAYDLKSMNKITSQVLERLGCNGCHSGFDLRFDIEKKFFADNKLEVFPGYR